MIFLSELIVILKDICNGLILKSEIFIQIKFIRSISVISKRKKYYFIEELSHMCTHNKRWFMKKLDGNKEAKMSLFKKVYLRHFSV